MAPGSSLSSFIPGRECAELGAEGVDAEVAMGGRRAVVGGHVGV
jgi:hypothetical protein